MNARGVAYKKLGKQKISTRTPKLDLTKLREYPAGDASVELPSKLAHKLAGRIITIQMYGGSRTHQGTLPVPGGAHADDYAGPCCGLQL